MHQLGLIGMPRRVYTYPDGMGWNELNLLASIGAGLIAASVAVFIANVIWSRRHGEIAGDNPWNAGTLEWATSSPPPPGTFSTSRWSPAASRCGRSRCRGGWSPGCAATSASCW